MRERENLQAIIFSIIKPDARATMPDWDCVEWHEKAPTEVHINILCLRLKDNAHELLRSLAHCTAATTWIFDLRNLSI